VDKTLGEMGDYLLVGGGLQNCLIALFLLARAPETRITLVERGGALGGNHTWSFHAEDIPESYREILAPAVHRMWDSYDVFFPGLERRVWCAYGTMLSSDMDSLLQERFAACAHARLVLGQAVASVADGRVTLHSGEVLHGRHVIDGRGADKKPNTGGKGYQKFVGLELQLRNPCPHDVPLLMDARVPQVDGFRFFYVLPFAPDRVLVEDTRFSNNADLDIPAMQQAVLHYVAEKGLGVREILRTEYGVLPMPYTVPATWPGSMPLDVGYRGGFFHPATGYSVPIAARIAAHIADRAPDSPLNGGWHELVDAHRQQYRFATFLNRLLFTACKPEFRYTVFERFYRLPESAIGRFYRMEMSVGDKARMFLGRPPRGFSLRHLFEGAPLS